MGLRSGWQRLRGRDARPALDADGRDLVVVVSSFDDAEACSTALARAVGWSAPKPAVLRHHLRVPVARWDEVIAIAAQDGYSPRPETPAPDDTGDPVPLILQRVQPLDALHCSQERSRMAGLAQRHDGTVLGWDALQPGTALE